jgi:hypothetical protein
MFEKFSEGARRVVVRAQEEARLLDHDHIGTEHLLLAMLHDEVDGVGQQVLRAAGITYDRVHAHVVEIVGRGEVPPSGDIPFSPRAKRVLELSLREALEVGDREIRSEHILLGLLREGSGVAAEVLVELGADVSQLRHEVIARRGATSSEPERAVARGAMSTHAIPQTAPAPGLRTAAARCSFCSRREERVGRFLVAGGVLICDECVRDAAAQLDELADDAPKRVRFRRRDVGVPDERAAQAAIERAFEAIFGPMQLPLGDASWAVEGGEALESQLRAMREAAEYAPVVVNDVTVERVRFVDEAEADVSLGFWMPGSTSPIVMPAHAVLQDGTWKVSRSTIEHFAQLGQAPRRPPF